MNIDLYIHFFLGGGGGWWWEWGVRSILDHFNGLFLKISYPCISSVMESTLIHTSNEPNNKIWKVHYKNIFRLLLNFMSLLEYA